MPNTPVEYEPGFLEEAVHACLLAERSPAGRLPAFRARRRHEQDVDSLYAVSDPEDRETGFRRHYRALFLDLGMDAEIRTILGSHPGLLRLCERVIVRSASGRPEGLTTYSNASGQFGANPIYLVIALRPARFTNLTELREFLGGALEAAVDQPDRDRTPRSRGDASVYCAACRLPSTVWAAPPDLAGLGPTLAREIPAWSANASICAHCAERYRSTLLDGP
jgi:hypothetical protein